MINKQCLICHLEAENHEILDVYDVKHEFIKELLEKILQRRLFPERFAQNQVCTSCHQCVTEYDSLQRRLEEITFNFKSKFDGFNPVLRGRKKLVKNISETEIVENKVEPIKTEAQDKDSEETRKSGRKRKIKDLDYFITDTDSKNVEKRNDKLENASSSKLVITRPILKMILINQVFLDSTILSSMATKCPHCDFAADSEAQIERHLKKLHSEDGKAFACEHCGKSFALKSNLLSHQKTHDLDKPFGCDKCDKVYKQRNSLREHVLRSHDNISKFTCTTCFEKFPSRHLLKNHERSHNGERGFVCPECGSVFSGKQALESHMSKHSGEFTHFCQTCNKGFNCQTMLYEHSLIHSGEKPFSCDTCGLKFSNRGTLWVHKKRHENPKPYNCPFCQKCFSHSSHLAVHKRIHTGKVIFQ